MKIRSILFAVDDLDSAIDMMVGQLGCTLKFRDGRRYGELDAGGQTLALVAEEERLIEGAGLSVRVEDLAAATRDLVAQGAVVLDGPTQGPHEVRSVLRAAGGLTLVLSAKTATA